MSATPLSLGQTNMKEVSRAAHDVVAEREHVSLDQIIALALASQLAVWKVREDIETRAKRGNLADFDRIMAKVPDVPPMPGDELLEGYKPARQKE